jgi:hypothetical protein
MLEIPFSKLAGPATLKDLFLEFSVTIAGPHGILGKEKPLLLQKWMKDKEELYF